MNYPTFSCPFLVGEISIGYVYVAKRFDWDAKTGFHPAEDMAQLSGELAENKDQSTLEEVAITIKKYANSPTIELAEFYRRLLFCFAIGNGDMHLKNWSLYRDPSSSLIKMSPFYDYLNVRASFPQEQVEMILPMNGKQKDLTRNDFETFGREIGINEAFIRSSFKKLPQWAEVIQEFCSRSALSSKLKDRYLTLVTSRLSKLA